MGDVTAVAEAIAGLVLVYSCVFTMLNLGTRLTEFIGSIPNEEGSHTVTFGKLLLWIFSSTVVVLISASSAIVAIGLLIVK